MSGNILWNIVRQACYSYVHHIKTERSFGDTLTLSNNILYNPKTVTWVKDNEIRYAGKMFDIKHSSTDGCTTTMIGHYDDLDYELFKILNKLLEQDEKAPLQNNAPNWLLLTAIVPQHYNSTIPNRCIYSRACYSSWQHSFYKSIVLSLSAPPPDDIA